MLRFGCIVMTLLLGGVVIAGPFSRRHPIQRTQCSGASCQTLTPIIEVPETTSPIATMQSPESRQEDHPVQQPWLLISGEDDICLQAPDTALEPLPGTGLKLPIGPKAPDKTTVSIDPASLDSLKKIVDILSSSNKAPVAISLPIEAETSQRLSRISMILEWFLMLGGGYFGLSKTGGVLRLAAQVVAGLPSAIQAASQAQVPTAAATSSVPINPSPAVNQAAASSMGTLGS